MALIADSDAPGGPTTHSRFMMATRLVLAFWRRSRRKPGCNLRTSDDLWRSAATDPVLDGPWTQREVQMSDKPMRPRARPSNWNLFRELGVRPEIAEQPTECSCRNCGSALAASS